MSDKTVQLDKTGAAAVDKTYYWEPIETCPCGVKVQLLGAGGVAVYGNYNPPKGGERPWWTHWAPLPTKRKPT